MTGLCKFDEIYFVFLPPAKKKKEAPTHIAAHLQTRTACPDLSGSQRSNQRFAKELPPFQPEQPPFRSILGMPTLKKDKINLYFVDRLVQFDNDLKIKLII